MKIFHRLIKCFPNGFQVLTIDQFISGGEINNNIKFKFIHIVILCHETKKNCFKSRLFKKFRLRLHDCYCMLRLTRSNCKLTKKNIQQIIYSQQIYIYIVSICFFFNKNFLFYFFIVSSQKKSLWIVKINTKINETLTERFFYA